MREEWSRAERTFLSWVKRRDEKALSLLGAARDYLFSEAGADIVDHILQTGEVYPPIKYTHYWQDLGEPTYSVDTAYLNLSRCSRMQALQKVISTIFNDAMQDVGMVDEVVEQVLRAVAQKRTGFITYDEAKRRAKDETSPPLWPTAVNGVFDLIQGLRRGQVYMMAGDPGAGKSTITCQMAYDIAQNGGRVVVYAIDMGIERTKEIFDLCGGADGLFITITDAPTSVAEFLSHAFHYRVTGIDLIVVDQLQQLMSTENSLEQRVTQAASALAEVARRCNCVVWGCSRVNRSVDGPSLHGIYGAHNVGHEVAGLTWMTKRIDGKTQFHIIKNRFAPEPSGPVNLYRDGNGLFTLGEYDDGY